MLHRDLAAGRWETMTIAEQMGNVGSEVGRALKWKDRNPEIARNAVNRALDLMDLTLADPRYRASVARLREIARTREALVDFLIGSNEYGSTAASLQRYFNAFAMAAARARHGQQQVPKPT